MNEKQYTFEFDVDDAIRRFFCGLEAKYIKDDLDNWYEITMQFPRENYIPLQYKPSFLDYQEEYFRNVYDFYKDISVVLYRGGSPVGIWPVCVYIKDNRLCIGTAGTALMPPLLIKRLKAESQRAILEKCIGVLCEILNENDGEELYLTETVLDQGCSQWVRKLMEHGAVVTDTRWQAFVDLSLSQEEIQSRIRRTNKYSVAKGYNNYDVEVYDETNIKELDGIFDEFHMLHYRVSGRETRSQKTWDIQKKIVREGNDRIGRSFIVQIKDKNTKELAGAALFDTTLQSGLYCVAAYDRARFSQPVGHIVQAVAMEKMRELGIRWYEIGERTYPGDNGADEKTVNIGHYKEGFATHLFPKVFLKLRCKDYSGERE